MATPTSATLAIVNPHAGGGAMHDAFRRVEHPVLDRIGEFDVAFTEGPGDATRLAREALDAGCERILVAGGDGTVHEVVNGWLDERGRPRREGAVMALLAGGTGGDLRRTLGLTDVEASIAALVSGRVRTLDLGRVVHAPTEVDGAPVARYVVNVASFGLGGIVDRELGQLSALGGRMAYATATARALLQWRNPRVRLRLTGVHPPWEADTPLVAAAVANGRYFGGGMCIAPDAVPDDGRFHVTILGDMRRREVLGLATSIYRGAHVEHPSVMVREATRVEAESDEDVYLDLDGEPVGRLPATFEIVPGVLPVAVP